jgi:hypothetical protein
MTSSQHQFNNNNSNHEKRIERHLREIDVSAHNTEVELKTMNDNIKELTQELKEMKQAIESIAGIIGDVWTASQIEKKKNHTKEEQQ